MNGDKLEIMEPESGESDGFASQGAAPSRFKMPAMTLDNAWKIYNWYQQEPQWLANNRTRHAAEADLAHAARIISMNMQMERVGAMAEASKARNSIAREIGTSLLKLSESGRGGAAIAAKWFALDDQGKPLYENPTNATAIFKDYESHIKPSPESTAGKEEADLAALIASEPLGENSPRVKKFQELTAAPLSDLGRLLRERATASPDDRLLYDKRIAGLSKAMGFSIQYDDQNRPIINYGPQESSIGAPSVATQSMAQRKLLKYEAASELINHLQRNMESGHVGVAGVLGEYVGDRLLPQLGVDTFKGKRADVRSTLIAARESLLREISDDSRFSNLDREEISKALPSSGAFESLENAQQRLSTVRNILNARGRTYSEGLGLSKPEWSLTPDEIRTQYEKFQASGGKEGMSFEKAKLLLERFH